MDVERILKKAFVSCPFDLLVDKYLDRLVETRINPEIGLNRSVLNRFSPPDFVRVAEIFRTHGIRCTVHGPFTDISVGALDDEVRSASTRRFRQAIDAASILGASSVVMHSGYDYRQYLGAEDEWLENFIKSLSGLVEYAANAGITIMLENVYEPTPTFHEKIFTAVDTPTLRFCLDLGHLNVFSPDSTLEQWLGSIGHRIGELHLHDNFGIEDDHLPPGQGNLDFDALFSWLEVQKICPILTLEAHDEDAVFPAIEGLGKLLDKYAVCAE